MQITLQSGSIAADVDVPEHAVACAVSGQGPQVLASSLRVPLGLPGLNECAVAGDRVAIVVDPQMPEPAGTLAQVWDELHAGSLSELSVAIVFPADPHDNSWASVVDQLPEHIRGQAAIHVHDPAEEAQRHYLASSAGGERIYLSEHVVDADLIITVGGIAFDSLLGYRGTSSAVYPALSDAGTIMAACGQGHSELTPENKRPLRELVDEVGWLLGTQFSVQVIPNSAGEIGFAYSGAPDKVMQAGQAALKNHWWYERPDHADLTIITLPPALPQLAWKELGRAVETAGRITADEGRIVLCAELPPPESPGLTLLRRCAEPADLIKPLQLEPGPDTPETLQLIRSLSQHRVLLLSNLPAGDVEDLGLLALDSAGELQRIIDGANRCCVLQGSAFWTDISG